MTTEELNVLIAQAESGDVVAMNQLGHFYMIHHDVENLIMDGFLELTDSFTNKLRQHPLPQGWQWVNRENLEEKTLNSCVAAFRECIQANIQVAKKVIESGSGERLDSLISDTLIIELTYFIKKISTTLNEMLKGVQWATFDTPKDSSLGNMIPAVMDFVQENIKISREMDEMKNFEMAFNWHKKAAELGNIMSMNKLTYIYGELGGYINYSQAIKWFKILVQKDSDPQSEVYHNTQYNKALCKKIVGVIDNAMSEYDLPGIIYACANDKSHKTSLFSRTIYACSKQEQNDVKEIHDVEKSLLQQTLRQAQERKDLKRRAAAGDFKAACEIVFSDPEKTKALLQELKKNNNP